MEILARTPQNDQIDKQQFVEAPKNWALQRTILARADTSRTPPGASSASLQELLAYRQAYRETFEEALSRNQAMVDAIELAAEQVQDIRLALLEAGPEVDANSVVFSLLVTFLLDSNLAGRMAAALVGSVLKPIIHVTVAVKMAKYRTALERDWREYGIPIGVGSPEGLHNMFKIADEIVNETKEATVKSTVKWVNALTGSTFKDSFKGAGKAGLELYKQYKLREKNDPGANEPVSFGFDSPGVAFRRLGYNYLASLKSIGSQGMAHMDDEIARALLEPNRAAEILKRLKAEGFIDRLGKAIEYLHIAVPGSPGQDAAKDGSSKSRPTSEDIRFHFSLAIETAIWSLMYGNKIEIGTDLSTVVPNKAEFEIKGVDGRLADYWMMRFLDPKTYKPFESKNRLAIHMKKTYDGLNKIKRIAQTGETETDPILVGFTNPHP